MHKIYIGYDSREKIAAEVCKYSLKKNTKKKISTKYLKLNSLRKKKLYTRKKDKLSSTEFTFSRFLVPILNKYNGWAIFCDCDFLWSPGGRSGQQQAGGPAGRQHEQSRDILHTCHVS